MLKKIHKALKEGGISLLLERLFIKSKSVIGRRTYLPYLMGKPDFSGELVLLDSENSASDFVMAERILTAYRKALKHNIKKTGDLWDLIQEKHDDISHFSIFQLAYYLREVNKQNIAIGIASSGPEEFKDLESNAQVRREYAALIKDNLNSLQKTCMDYPPYIPIVGKEVYKLNFNGYFFDTRDIHSYYTFLRIRTHKRVAEIGPGMGEVAYYAFGAGIDYSLFDLPISNVLQAWYLHKTGIDVSLYGEKQEKDTVKVLPFWEFGKRGKYDIVVNADSFPEIDDEIVKDYLEKIKKCSKYLWSRNKENAGAYGQDRKHGVVPNLIREVGGFTRLYRQNFPLQEGYIEELYATGL